MALSYAPGMITITTSAAPTTAYIDADNGGAVPVRVSTQQIANLFGSGPSFQTFATAALTSAQQVTLSSTVNFTAYQLTQTAASLTINLPLSPSNNQVAGFTIDGAVTALIVNASTNSQTVDGLVALSASTASIGAYKWSYQTSNTTWYRAV